MPQHRWTRPTASRRPPSRATARLAVAVVAALALVLGLPVPAGAAALPDQWSGPFGDAGNTSTDAGERTISAARAAQVRPTWTVAAGPSVLSPQAPVVLNGTAYWIAGSDRLVATSLVDGATRWTLRLSGGQDYSYGLAAAGKRIVIAFRGRSTPSGIAAVDPQRRKVVWRSLLPKPKQAGDDPAYPGLPYTDGARVFIAGAGYAMNAYRLTDGRALWRKGYERDVIGLDAPVDGIAAGGGLVYTSGQNGLVALRATSGRPVWRSKDGTSGRPVLTGARIVVANGPGLGVESYAAKGCGSVRCAPTWQVPYITPAPVTTLDVAAADAQHVYLAYRTSGGTPPDCTSAFVGRVTRLSATTGATEWTTAVGTDAEGLVRGGDVLWLYSGDTLPNCTGTTTLIALAATGSSTAPLVRFDLGPSAGFPQTLSIAGGTLLRQDRLDPLVGYRLGQG